MKIVCQNQKHIKVVLETEKINDLINYKNNNYNPNENNDEENNFCLNLEVLILNSWTISKYQSI